MPGECKVFLDNRLLLRGPWQAFERAVARLLIHHGFDDVRIVGGSGDRGADILATKDGRLWIVQCKFTTASPPPVVALQEVLNAGSFYRADELLIAVSRNPTGTLKTRIQEEGALGVRVSMADPATLLQWGQSAPEYCPSSKVLRDYQRDVVNVLVTSLKDCGKGQVVLATGLGKTVVMAETVACLLRDGALAHNRILVLAHTKELVDQLLHSFWFQLPSWVDTHKFADGETPCHFDGITFATVQTASSKVSQLQDIDLVLIDEAHHAGADTYRKLLDSLGAPMVAGVTATPWRGDGYDIDVLLGPALVRIGIAEGLQNGFLSNVDYRLLADNLDWEFVQSASANRYSLSQLNRRLIIPTRDEEAAKQAVQVFNAEHRRAAIVYCPSGVHAKEFAACLRQFGKRAEAVLGETDDRERALLMSRFRAGHLDFVCTVDLFNEGVDVPDVDLILFMRATHSRRIFVQQLGRGLRISDGKDRLIVLDFVTDLRRVAEVVDLDAAVRGADVERLGLGRKLISFSDRSAGSFLKEWMLDQASLIQREGDPTLEIPRYNFPETPSGGVQ
jgi:superfamily II DNA or RNA helicase